MKNLFFLLICIGTLAAPARAVELSLKSDRPIYEPGDNIQIFAEIYNDYPDTASIVLDVQISGGAGRIPGIKIPYSFLLAAEEGKTLAIYEAPVREDFPAGEYTVTVRLTVNNVLETEESLTFRVAGVLQELEVNIQLCADEECRQEARVFLVDRNVYFRYQSSVADVQVSGTLSYPNGNRERISLPAVLQFAEPGAYAVEIIASRPGYRTVNRQVQFSVIEKSANIPQHSSIREIKGPEWNRQAGKTVTVEGIFVRDPLPMLVSRLDWVLQNTPIPPEEYILLVGDKANEMNAEEHGGAKIKATGVATVIDDTMQFHAEIVALKLLEFQQIERVRKYAPDTTQINILLNPKPNRYAVLFSGGINPTYSYLRYWNDLKFMYSTLVNKYGFTDKTIAVLYANGKGKDKQMPVHYSATQANLVKVFNLLKQVSTKQDLIFVFTTNHGGGFYKKDPAKKYNVYGGQVDGNGDEGVESIYEKDYNLDLNGNGSKFDQVAWDEELFSWGGAIMDDAFPNLFQGLKYDKMIIIMEQCFSGGFIRDMAQAGTGKIIMTAATQYEVSWAMPPKYNYDEFNYHVTCGLNGADANGKKVNADSNKDKKVSMVEVFNYARSRDTASETPLYEDSGDGVPHAGKMPSKGDGTLGGKTFLK